MYRFSFLAVCVAAVISLNPTFGQSSLTDTEAAAIESYVTDQMKRQHVPGASISIVRSERLAFSKAFGIANLELNVPATTNSVFKIGSTSKPFIASGIMMLVEEAKLSLDDDIAKFSRRRRQHGKGSSCVTCYLTRRVSRTARVDQLRILFRRRVSWDDRENSTDYKAGRAS